METTNPIDNWPLIAERLRKKVQSIELIKYEFQGKTDSSNTLVQINFEDGTSVYFTSDRDGETLKVCLYSWDDPFAGDLSAEQISFVEKSGKWSKQDVSSLEPFSYFIGESMSEITPIRTNSKITGVNIIANGAYIKVMIEWDESHVSTGRL